jgi:hypothetical protein
MKPNEDMTRARYFAFLVGIMSALDDIKQARILLLQLHRILLELLRQDHERTKGSPVSPTAWFQLLLNDQEYKWLEPLNTIVSDIDALSERTEATDEDRAIIRHEVEALFFDGTIHNEFRRRYQKILAEGYDLLVLHNQLKHALVKWPQVQGVISSRTIRDQWHKRDRPIGTKK